MTGLNINTDRIVLIINCKVKDSESFKNWSRDRASKYVYDLKEENSINYEWHISRIPRWLHQRNCRTSLIQAERIVFHPTLMSVALP